MGFMIFNSWQFPSALAEIKMREVAQIACSVCELAMTETSGLVVEKAVDRKNPDALTDFVEGICVLSKREGRWLRRLDVINSPSELGRLEVNNMTEYGECRHECQLVRKACQVALRSKEEDLVDLLGKSAGLDTLKKKICKK